MGAAQQLLLAGSGGAGGGGDPFFDSVKALLHFEGVDASTTFTDVIGKTWTANGNAQIDTAQFKYGAASGLFDGTGDYISTPDHADFSLGTNDFCYEFFFRPAVLGARGIICGQSNSAGTGDFSIFIEKTAADVLSARAFFSASSVTLTGTTPVSADTWYHGAFTRSGSDFHLFLDGTEEDTDSSALSIVNSTSIFSIGRTGALDSLYFNGWLDEFRFTNGAARYTSNFTPPSEAFPDS